MVMWLAEKLLVALQISEPEIKPKYFSSPGWSGKGQGVVVSEKRSRYLKSIKGQLNSSGADTQFIKRVYSPQIIDSPGIY